MNTTLDSAYEYLIGIDGGGTKTQIRIARADGSVIAEATGGPSALMHGRDKAWAAIGSAIHTGFHKAGISAPSYNRIAAGFGLSGVNVPSWAAEFTALNPGFGSIAVASDAITTLLGAHQGRPGAIIALGTGSIGAVLKPDGVQHIIGGWGFPSGDEASGAWLGILAINHVEQVFDGRTPQSILATNIIRHCGGDGTDKSNRDSVLAWLANANQSMYAQLAPFIFQHAVDDEVARNMLWRAGNEIAKMALALDVSEQLPLALCGGLAHVLKDYLPQTLQLRTVPPEADSSSGGLLLIRQHLEQ
ncbi:BadF/BadG/BcrA/BcrD ATPase family protein [Glaciimonas sp. CA11.2]|uniref:BadF/BadG/BcrA/BcrD ATPase family protein n=1 Tax=Glaciimonas sp. CA11.2 TaxID=3048601 RepID=UPI002AB4BE2D|nr:BadF/BadG/BcrA/BcrD ATPase family protein [Glaciimonas sp. CA11.2]MDY7548059.1 BadF/BadG/BcrA/BcrD ATPase family protein [Glaciimonas sp. CA11.2]